MRYALFLLAFVVLYSSVYFSTSSYAQNLSSTNASGVTDSDGLSVESVDIANSNSTEMILNNSSSNGTDSDGLSVESVDIA